MMVRGVNDHPLWSDLLPSEWFTPWLDVLARSGGTVLRFDADWRQGVTPALTNLLELLASRRVVPHVSLGAFGAQWTAPDPWAYAVKAAEIAAALPDDAAIEVWNEPNIGQFYVPVVDYTRLVIVSYPAIKQAQPHVRVLAGSIAYNDAAYRRQFLTAQPGLNFDALTIHPYTGTTPPNGPSPDNTDVPMNSFEAAIRDSIADLQAAGRRAEVIISELGWFVTNQQDTVSASYWRAAREIAGKYPEVTAMIAYDGGSRQQSGAGADMALLDIDRKPSCSWSAFFD